MGGQEDNRMGKGARDIGGEGQAFKGCWGRIKLVVMLFHI